MYKVILRNIKHPDQVIVLDEWTTMENAQNSRKGWRRVLGGKFWEVDRRPGLDTNNFLALTVVKDNS